MSCKSNLVYSLFCFGGVFLLTEGIEIAILLDTYEKLLTKTQASILRMRFDEDLSLGEIGEILNISRPAVRNAIIKGEEKLKYYEDILNIVKRERAIINIADQLDSVDDTKKYAKMLKNVLEEV